MIPVRPDALRKAREARQLSRAALASASNVSERQIGRMLAYARTADSFLTSLHDVAPRSEDGGLWIPFFNPGPSKPGKPPALGELGEVPAEATIAGSTMAGGRRMPLFA